MYTYLDAQFNLITSPLLLPQYSGQDAPLPPYQRLDEEGATIRLDSGTYADTYGTVYTYALSRMRAGAQQWEVWYYQDMIQAGIVYFLWAHTPEPSYWSYHPATGRTRIKGNPDWEYIQSLGTVLHQVKYALHVDPEMKRIPLSLVEERRTFTPVFAEGTRLFRAESQQQDCPHTPPCLWTDYIFWYQGRTVIIPRTMAQTLTLGTIALRLGQDLYKHTRGEECLSQIGEVHRHPLK